MRNTLLKPKNWRIFIVPACLLFASALCSITAANDWPTYRADNERSGISSESLKLPLKLNWVYQARHAPQPAWPRPAKHDLYRNQHNLKPTAVFDRAYQVVAAGESVYFGSSADDKVYCLDASTGAERWSFFTEGPVRLAPTVANGKLYVGSDDGWVYCLKAEDGSLLWKYKPTAAEHRIPGNGRIMSLWPVRSSVMIHNGLAMFCAGLFPGQGAYFASLNAEDGKERNKEQIDISSQGYLMIKDGKLFTPTGRAGPVSVADIEGTLSETLPDGLKGFPYSVIRCGDVFFAGGDDKVGALRLGADKMLEVVKATNAEVKKNPRSLGIAEDQLWTSQVKGRAYCLAAANGKLFVSTDKGFIYCFSEKTSTKTQFVRPVNNPAPHPGNNLAAIYAQAAKQIVEQTGIKKGYALVLASNKGQLARELAKLTDLKIICVEADARKVAQSRKMLDEAGLYGRVVVHHGTQTKLPYGKYLFNLIVSDETIITGKLPGTAGEVFRVLRPCGGAVYIGRRGKKLSRAGIKRWLKNVPTDGWNIKQDNGTWVTFVRSPLPGSGQWSHQYADAGNTSCSNDKLIKKPMQLQWFGRPGPYDMVDRHSRPPAPLSTNGRLFIPAENQIYGLDAYNGTILWDLKIPELQTRVNIPHDSSYMAADDNYLYVAVGDQCRQLAADTGKLASSYRLPSTPVKNLYDWGYLACKDNLIFGSCVRKGAAFTDAKGPWYDGSKDFNAWENAKVCSDYLFATGKEDGKIKWNYKGTIINSAIALGDGMIYFVENRNKSVHDFKFRSARINTASLWKDLYLVALNTATGQKDWEKPVEFAEGTMVFYLCYSNGKLLVVSSPYTSYWLYAFNASDGSLLWETESTYRTDRNTKDHGGHMQHPVIMDDVIYQDPNDFDLITGVQGQLLITRGGHGCGSLSAAPGYLFGRGDNPQMYDLSDAGKSIRLSQVSRPGCWINIIPAGGLVLIPEASSGCSCPFPVQTSMAFVSKDAFDFDTRK